MEPTHSANDSNFPKEKQLSIVSIFRTATKFKSCGDFLDEEYSVYVHRRSCRSQIAFGTKITNRSTFS